MSFARIYGPIRTFSKSDGTEDKFQLPTTSGGRGVKRHQYMVAVENSSGSDCQIMIELYHGPDGRLMTKHSTPITWTVANENTLLEGTASDSTSMIGEFTTPYLYIRDNLSTNQQWADVTVYEMKKPF